MNHGKSYTDCIQYFFILTLVFIITFVLCALLIRILSLTSKVRFVYCMLQV